MENKIVVVCPKCAQKLKVPGDRNVVAKCPRCGNNFETFQGKQFSQYETRLDERTIWNKNPFSAKGKLSRLQFFITTSILGAIFVATAIPTVYLREERTYNMIHNIPNSGSDLSFWTLAILANIMVVLLIFAFVKRLRDVNKSPWWLFICFIPFVVWFVWLYLVFKPSHQ